MLLPSLMLLRYILLCKLGSGSCLNMLEITGPNLHQGKQEIRRGQEKWKCSTWYFFQLEGNNKNA